MKTKQIPQQSKPHRRSRERGVALALALFAMAALLVGATGALFVSADDLQATRNYRGAQQVHFAAESGLTHALQNVNAVGIVDFQQELVDNWDDWLDDDEIEFEALPGFTYSVVPIADAANPSQLGWLRATATGPEGVSNVAVARVQQSNIPGTAPGAIYLANDDPTDSEFIGNNFYVDGNDYNLDGTPNPTGKATPGIAARNEENTLEAIDSLQDNGSQSDNVQGQGYQAGPPIIPSIKTAPTGASVDQLNNLIDTLLAQPGVNEYSNTTINNKNSATFNAPTCGIGCCEPPSNNPKISHFTADDLTIKGNGNVSGCGIMIVEGDFTIQGTLDFAGLVLVRGGTSIEPDSETGFLGNALLYGSLWTSNLNLLVGGSATVKYSSEALSFANSVIPPGALPAPLDVLALVDCAQVPAGTSGCP
jgi:hypothetical protein